MKERKEDVMEKLTYSETLIITAKNVFRDNAFSDEICVSSILDTMVDIRENHSGIDETTETGMLTILSVFLAKKLTRNDVMELLDAMHWGVQKDVVKHKSSRSWYVTRDKSNRHQ